MASFDSIPLKVWLPLVILGAVFLMSAFVGMISYLQLETLVRSDVDASANDLLVSRKTAVESFYAEIGRNVQDAASSPLTMEGFRDLELGWKSEGQYPQAELTADYVTNTLNPQGKRINLDKAYVANTYSIEHARFYPTFRKWNQHHGYDDFFLIDTDGNVVFTVDKGPDFARNLLTGPVAKGPLADTFRNAKVDTSATVHFSDFIKYGTYSGAALAFAAKSLLSDDSKVIGVFAVQISPTALKAVVDNSIGLGTTGEVLVGPDGLARNALRFAGHFGMLDALPPLPQLDGNPATDHVVMRHTKLTSGDIGTALTTKAKIEGVDSNILVEIADTETYVRVFGVRQPLVFWSVAAAAVLTVLGILISKTITRPIARVSSIIRAIAAGDLSVVIKDADPNDEIGDIAKAVDSLCEKWGIAANQEEQRHQRTSAQRCIVDAESVGLRELSSGNLTHSIHAEFSDQEALRQDFNKTVERLSETISMVVETSESILSRACEISQSSENLSTRTETQAATLEETTAALDELTASIRSAAEGTKEVEGIVRSARTEAEESDKVVQGAVSAMTEIERSSDQISQIIGVLDDIAFQTNLLALNTGVEAARTGDAGKGSAVVASGMRALAQRSSAAAKEIKSLISASTQHVGRGVEQVGRSGNALANIVNRVGHISTLVPNIAPAATEQSTRLAEINICVSQLDQVTQQNAAMVKEATAARQSMSQEAAGLSELVAQFQLRKSSSTGVNFVTPLAGQFASLKRPRRDVIPRAISQQAAKIASSLAEMQDVVALRPLTASAKGNWQGF